MTLKLSCPVYLSPNEQEELKFAVKNNHSENIDATFLLNSSNKVTTFINIKGTNSIYSGKLESRGEEYCPVNIYIPVNVLSPGQVLGQPAGLSLLGSVQNAATEKIHELPIMIGTIPWANKLILILLTLWLGLFGWIGKQLWEAIKTSKK